MRESNPGTFLEPIVIAHRFRGPMRSGNGGYTCGRIAALLPSAGAVEVTLRLPPPLETPLRAERAADGVRLVDGDRLVAEARPAELDLDLPEPLSYADAAALAAARPDDAAHPFPGCFSCGPARAEGDGLRLRPTPVGDGRVVAPWRPAEAARALVWAALDCPGAYAVNPDFTRGVSVLGRLTARVAAVPDAGDECVVVAWPIEGGEGRRLNAGTAVYRRGEPIAWARAVWFLVGDERRDDPAPG